MGQIKSQGKSQEQSKLQAQLKTTSGRDAADDIDDDNEISELVNPGNCEDETKNTTGLPEESEQEYISLEFYLNKIKASYLIFINAENKLELKSLYRINYLNKPKDKLEKLKIIYEERFKIINGMIEIQEDFIKTENLTKLKPLYFRQYSHRNDKKKCDVIDCSGDITKNAIFHNIYILLPSGNLYSMDFLFPDEYRGYAKTLVFYYISEILNSKTTDTITDSYLAEKVSSLLTNGKDKKVITDKNISKLRENMKGYKFIFDNDKANK